jgi:outer membrane lipoprotein-sorting protein
MKLKSLMYILCFAATALGAAACSQTEDPTPATAVANASTAQAEQISYNGNYRSTFPWTIIRIDTFTTPLGITMIRHIISKNDYLRFYGDRASGLVRIYYDGSEGCESGAGDCLDQDIVITPDE